MAHTERSSHDSYAAYPDQKRYDDAYHELLLPMTWGRVLDVGCGAGLLTVKVADREEVDSVLALDKVLVAPEHPKIRYVKADLSESIPVFGEFDTIISTEFIEHIPREGLDFLLEDIRVRLADGGVFCGSTPHVLNRSDNPFHIYEYNEKELLQIFKQHFDDVYTNVINSNCIIWRVVG